MLSPHRRYLLWILIITTRSGIVLWNIKNIDFQTQQCAVDDVFAQHRYERKQRQNLTTKEAEWNIDNNSAQQTEPTKIDRNNGTVSDLVKTSIGQTSYTGSNILSLDSILESLSDIPIHNNFISTKTLEDNYKNHPTTENAIDLIIQLVKEYKYSQAYDIINKLDLATLDMMNPHLIMRIIFNSPLIAKKQTNKIATLIQEFTQAWLLTSKDKQRYDLLLLLAKDDFPKFLIELPHYQPNEWGDIAPQVHDLLYKIAQSQQGQDMPLHYTYGMMTLAMFQYGYPGLAQEMAIHLLVQHPGYILPKQILAYSHMILQDWRQATSYFLELIEQDPANIHTYQFFVGVCSYWLGEYTNTVLYLDQIPQDKILSDATRYKLLAYIKIEDWGNVARQFKALLEYSDIKPTDMMLAWEHMIFEPYILNKNYIALDNDPKLLDLYITTCENSAIDKSICRLGKLARSLSFWGATFALNDLKELTNQFPKSYMYYILGQEYLKQKDTANAQKSFVSATSLTTNPEIKKFIVEQLEKTIQS